MATVDKTASEPKNYLFNVGQKLIDTETLLEDSMAAKRIPIDKLEDKIELNGKKITAYGEFKDKLTTFQTSLDNLRNNPKHDIASIFDKRVANLAINSANSVDSYVSITAQDNSMVNSFDLVISQLATAKQEKSGSFATDDTSVTEAAGGTTAGMFSAGTFQINGIDITIDEGDSLNDIISKINAQESETNVVAYKLKVADGDFRMVLKSSETGLANAYSITDTTGVLDEIGLTTLQNANDSLIEIDGQQIYRPTNEITDIFDNLTISLKKETGVGEEIAVAIDNDVELVQAEIMGFLNSYNEIMMFQAEQTERTDDGEDYVETAYLAKDSNLSRVIWQIQDELMTTVSGLNADGLARLADINLTFKEYKGIGEFKIPFKNAMMVDEQGTEHGFLTLEEALKNNFDDVRKIFEFNFEADSSNLLAYERSNDLGVNSFQVDIDDSRAAGSEVIVTYLDSNSVMQTINADYEVVGSSVRIVGQEGTVLEGLTMLYIGGGVEVINVTASQGIADRTYNLLDDMLDEVDGIISQSVENYNKDNEIKQNEIERLEYGLEQFKKTLLAKISKLEQVSGEADHINKMLQAYDSERNKK